MTNDEPSHMPKKAAVVSGHKTGRMTLTDEDIIKFEAAFPHMAFPRSDTRCMILPPGEATWREVFAQVFPLMKLQENRKFSGEFRDVNQALISRGRHRMFTLSLPTGTLLLDGGGSMIWPDLDPFCSAYSRVNHCTVVWLQERDAAYCAYPKISVWDDGVLLRKHAPGLREKHDSYLQKGFITQEQFDWFVEHHQSVGAALPCEESPDALSILAYYGWTKDVFKQSGWTSVTTSFD